MSCLGGFTWGKKKKESLGSLGPPAVWSLILRYRGNCNSLHKERVNILMVLRLARKHWFEDGAKTSMWKKPSIKCHESLRLSHFFLSEAEKRVDSSIHTGKATNFVLCLENTFMRCNALRCTTQMQTKDRTQAEFKKKKNHLLFTKTKGATTAGNLKKVQTWHDTRERW